MNTNYLKDNAVFSIQNIAIASAIWALLILRFGYFLGTGDHVELLPYSLFLNDHSLYPTDFFIQSLHASLPNERTIFANLLRPFTNIFPAFIFVLHYLNTLFLLLGLYKIAVRFFCIKWQTWLPIIVSIWVLNDKTLGNVDLYTPSIQAGDVACAIIAWAIAYFLDKRFLLSTFFLVIATFIHVLEGLDVMIVLSLVMFIFALKKELEWKVLLQCMMLYACTAFIFLAFLLSAKTNVESSLSDSQLFQILFVFRHPHHFIFSTFPVFNKLFFVVIALFGLYWYPKKSNSLFLFFLVGLSILLVYILATDYGHVIAIANFQWYKITQWLKIFSLMAIFAAFFSTRSFDFKHSKSILTLLSFLVLAISCVLIYTNKNPFHCPFQLAEKAYQYTDIDIALKAKSLTPKDALFVIPFANSSFKYWSKRGCYVDFKANVRNKAFVGEWYKRIGEVYGVDTTDPHLGFEKHWAADQHYRERVSSDFVSNWKQEGVTHIIADRKTDNPLLTLLAENADFYIYKIN